MKQGSEAKHSQVKIKQLLSEIEKLHAEVEAWKAKKEMLDRRCIAYDMEIDELKGVEDNPKIGKHYHITTNI